MAWSNGVKGQSSFEVMIALALLVIMTTAAFTLFGTTLKQSTLSEERQSAGDLEQEGLEAARQIRNTGWDNLTVGTHGLVLSNGTWGFAGTEDISGIFHRSLLVAAVDDNHREVTVTISWESAGIGGVQVQASTQLSTWQTATPLAVGTNCRSAYSASGDWTNPIVLGSADIGPGSQGTDVVVSLPYAFVSGTAASSSKSDLFIFDVSNTASPQLVQEIDIGAGGLNSLSLVGTYLYAASANDSGELMVFDVSDPLSTTRVAAADLTGSTDALSVLVESTWLALGRATGSASEIVLFDVSNPLVPSVVGSYNVGGDVNDFATDGTLLYAVSGSTAEDIVTIDMTDPVAPVSIGSFDLTDSSANTSAALQAPTTLFSGTADGTLLVLDVTDPLNITEISSSSTGGNVGDLLCVIDNMVFTGTANTNAEFRILDISDLYNITSFATLNFPQTATGVDFADNTVFVSVRSNDALRILTSSP